NESARKVDGELRLSAEGQALESRYIALPPGAGRNINLTLPIPERTFIKIDWLAEDSLAVDNHAIAQIPPQKPFTVGIVGNEHTSFLQRALTANPLINVRKLTPETFSQEHLDWILWHAEESPPETLSVPVVCFGVIPSDAPLSEVKAVTGVIPTAWDRAHSVNRFVDYRELAIRSSLVFNPGQGAKVLLKTEAGALMVLYWKNGVPRIVCGFRLFDSSWPYHASFPIFLHNVTTFFTRESTTTRAFYRTGEEILLPVNPHHGALLLHFPDGRERRFEVPAQSLRIALPPLFQPGIYRYRQERSSETFSFAVSFCNPAKPESVVPVTPQFSPVAGVQIREARGGGQIEYTACLLILASVLLILEWTVFHRRIGA
ncbi:MAG: hypothetical protein D6820_17700, partial [Lentisphaerae bacterium]